MWILNTYNKLYEKFLLFLVIMIDNIDMNQVCGERNIGQMAAPTSPENLQPMVKIFNDSEKPN